MNEGSSLSEAGTWVNLKPLGTEGQMSDKYNFDTYNNFQLAVPGGIGVNYRMGRNIDLSFQIGLRYLFFDYIDDISGDYVDLGALESDLAREMSDRSQELTSAITNEQRNMGRITQVTSNQSYVGADGRTYDVFDGFAHRRAHRDKRGFVKAHEQRVLIASNCRQLTKEHNENGKHENRRQNHNTNPKFHRSIVHDGLYPRSF